MGTVNVQTILDRLDRAEAAARKLERHLQAWVALTLSGGILATVGLALWILLASGTDSGRLEDAEKRLTQSEDNSAKLQERLEKTEKRLEEMELREIVAAARSELGHMDLSKPETRQSVWDTVTARAFTLVDAAGNVRGEFTARGTEPRLRLADAGGKVRVALCMRRDTPSLDLCDAAGKIRAMLCVSSDEPGLRLYDAAGVGRATVGAEASVSPDGRQTHYPESTLTLWGADGKMIWESPGSR
ncbi:MAG: hypothetical protein HY720_01075 [Planctomycetes bacterium]|nr:hypothetical protein [Planctomycetota bacterium]